MVENWIIGDVGGTKVFLSYFNPMLQETLAESRYECANFDSLEHIITQFIDDNAVGSVSKMALGLPAPVYQRQVSLTNLPWVVDADSIETNCGIEKVFLLNDFYAAALGVDALESSELLTLHDRPRKNTGNRLVVGAGTGLGVSPVKNCNGRFMPQASEGGHIDFAPSNTLQAEILAWLLNRWSHVSYERVLSGEGIENLYHFFNAKHHGLSHSHIQKSTSAQAIHQLTSSGDPIAKKTIETFVEIYGAFIGNAALLWHANDGIFIAGGIAPKLVDWMKHPRFVEAYLHKGRMEKVVDEFPIFLVTNEKVGLLGVKSYLKQLQ